MGLTASTRARAAGILSVLAVLLLAAGALPAATFQVLLDLDNNLGTGCMAVTAGGSFSGIEQILTTTVQPTGGASADVTAVAVETCVAGIFGAPTPVVAPALPWTVGPGLGDGSTNVIETYLPAALLPAANADPQAVRVVVVGIDGGPTADVAGPAVWLLAQILEIPTLGDGGLVLLTLFLLGTSLWALRRRGAVAGVLLVLVLGASAVWAAIALDGDPSDWSLANRIATDPAEGTTPGADVVSVYAKQDTCGGVPGFCFRLDAGLIFNQPPLANDDAATVAEDSGANTINVLANDLDPESDVFTIGAVTQPANGTVAITNGGADLTYTPNPNYCNTPPGTTLDTLTYSLNPVGDTATVTVTVTCVNDPPAITSSATPGVPEGQTSVIDVQSSDPDGETEGAGLTYSITGGADQALFSIVGATGVLTFNNPPDFENPGDAGGNNVYDMQVTVTDAALATGVQNLQVTVTDVTPEPPVITSPAAVSVPENQTAVLDVQSTDQDGDTEGAGLTYSLTGGADVALFSIVPGTGVLTFSAAPDFEAPGDAGANNVYDVQVTVTDSDTLTAVQNIQVTVTDVDEPPTITSSATPSVPENQTAVIDVQATDPEGDTEGAGLSYAITGGADAALFSIVPATGVLTFNSAPDFEAPTDAGANNVYDVQVTVTDSGTNTDVQNLQVAVTDTTEPPTITSSATPSVAENQTAVIDVQSTDPDGDTEGAGLTYSITGGADAALFSIVPATGVLTFNSAPDFEAPGDAGANNVYDVQVTVTDLGAQTDVQNLQVTVTNVDEPPAITSSATPSVPENQTAVIDVQATDPEGDTEGAGLTYSITGGADQALFSIVPATGVLTFNSAPDFEAPSDAGANNVYDVQVTVTDSGTNTGVQNLQVTVTNTTEPPAITSSATPSAPENQTAVIDVQATDPEGDTEGAGLTYSITGGADQALFSIVPATGVLTFNSAPNFELPGDAGANNVYDVQVTVTDSNAMTDVQALQVTVTDVNEAPTITSSATVSVPENQTAVIDVQSTDPEGDTEGAGLTYSITGGADSALFSVVPATGVLTFNSAPNFESPGDVGANNVYDVQVTVTDSGAQTGVQNLQVTVTDTPEPPSITSSATPSVPENQTAVIDVQSTDPDGDTEGAGLTYAITGGADQALFSIVPATGVLAFNSAPDFEAPADAGANNVYDVQVTVTDSDTQTAVQNLQVTVTNVNEAPTITSAATPSINENTTAVIDVQSTDPDGETEGAGLAYSITGGADSALFTIVPGSGALSFLAAPNFEAPADAGADNVYDVQVTVSDSGPLTDVQNLQVTVLNVPEPPIPGTDNYQTIGNTLLEVDATPGAAQPKVLVSGSVLDNDVNPEGGGMTTALNTATAGAVVTVNSDGSFTYVPPPGLTTPDSFTYDVTGSGGTATGTVNITFQERVWYVKNDAAPGGNGTSIAPFNSIAASNLADDGGDGDLTDDVDANADWIFVRFGDGAATNMSSGLRLEHQQHLIGEHAGLSIPVSVNGGPNPTVVFTAVAGNRPQLDDTVVGGPEGVGATPIGGVDVVPIEIVGMNLAGNVNAIDWATSAGGTGTFAILDNVIRSAGADGVDINLAGTAATTLAFSLNNLTSTGTALDIQETGTGALTIVSFLGNAVNGATGGSGIVVNSAIFDATPGGAFNTVTGGSTVIGASGNGVGGAGMVLAGTGDLSFTDLDIFADGGAAFALSGNGALNAVGATGARVTVGAGVGSFSATGGPAIDVSNATVDLQLTTLTSTNSASTGVSLVNVSDALNPVANATVTAGSGSAITNATGTDFSISGGNATVTYNGTITDDVGQLVNIANTTADTKSFTGAITDGDDGDGSGISISGNTGGAISFTGQLTLNTGGNAAFAAAGAGTLNATNTANKITTTTGVPLSVNGPDIAAGGLVFVSISANGAASGILLQDTGNVAGLTVNGTGTSDGTGGTIQNISGRGAAFINARSITLKNMNFTSANTADGGTCTDLSTAACNAAIHLSGVTSVTLDNLNVTTTAQEGINGLNVSGFTLNNSTLSNCGNAVEEGCLKMRELTGTCSITGSDLAFPGADVVEIVNTAGPTLTLNVDNSTLRDSQSSGSGNTGLQVRSQGTASMVVDVTNSSFLRIRTHGINAQAINSASNDVDVSGSTFDTGAGSMIGMSMEADHTGTMVFNIQSNPKVWARGGPAINVFGDTNAVINGRINNNSDVRVLSSVGGIGTGIRVNLNKDSTGKLDISNNVVNVDTFDEGIELSGLGKITANPGGATNTLDATVSGNNVTVGTTVASDYDIRLLSATGASETNAICVNVANNATVRNLATGNFRARVPTATGFLKLEGFVTDAAVTWDAKGNTPTTGAGGIVSFGGAGTFAACTAALPTNPALDDD